jgi:hypothetical protein
VDGFLGACYFGQLIEAGVGYGYNSFIRLDGAEGIVGTFGILFAGQGVKDGGFSHIGQSDDSDA